MYVLGFEPGSIGQEVIAVPLVLPQRPCISGPLIMLLNPECDRLFQAGNVSLI